MSFSAYANQDHEEHSSYDSEEAVIVHRNMHPDLVNVDGNLQDMFDQSHLTDRVFVDQHPSALSGQEMPPQVAC